MVEHRVQTHSTHKTVGGSVDRVAEGHVVGRYCFGDRPGCSAYVKKTPSHFLACANLGERPVLLPIEIDLERLPVGPDVHLRLHTNTVAAVDGRRKSARF